MARARGASESKIIKVQCCSRGWSEKDVEGYGVLMKHGADEINLRVVSRLNKLTQIGSQTGRQAGTHACRQAGRQAGRQMLT